MRSKCWMFWLCLLIRIHMRTRICHQHVDFVIMVVVFVDCPNIRNISFDVEFVAKPIKSRTHRCIGPINNNDNEMKEKQQDEAKHRRRVVIYVMRQYQLIPNYGQWNLSLIDLHSPLGRFPFSISLDSSSSRGTSKHIANTMCKNADVGPPCVQIALKDWQLRLILFFSFAISLLPASTQCESTIFKATEKIKLKNQILPERATFGFLLKPIFRFGCTFARRCS